MVMIISERQSCAHHLLLSIQHHQLHLPIGSRRREQRPVRSYWSHLLLKSALVEIVDCAIDLRSLDRNVAQNDVLPWKGDRYVKKVFINPFS